MYACVRICEYRRMHAITYMYKAEDRLRCLPLPSPLFKYLIPRSAGQASWYMDFQRPSCFVSSQRAHLGLQPLHLLHPALCAFWGSERSVRVTQQMLYSLSHLFPAPLLLPGQHEVNDSVLPSPPTMTD